MDVEFTVGLIKKEDIGWPRLENDTHIMVLGSARPHLEAFQIATAESQRWLMTDYGMTERGAEIFMGEAAERDRQRRRSELHGCREDWGLFVLDLWNF
jgi:amidase